MNKVVLHDYAGHPFTAQLARALAANGWEVGYIFNASDITPQGELAKKEDDPDTLSFFPVEIPGGFNKYSFLKRFKQERYYGRQAARKVKEFKPALVINANTPLAAYIQLQKAISSLRIKHVFWMQDFYSIAATKILKKKIPVVGGLIGAFFGRVEKSLLRKADKVILITEDFRSVIKEWGIEDKKVSVIPNWSPIEKIDALPKEESPWAKAKGLDSSFNILYSGTLAFKHNPEHVFEIAKAFEQHEDVKVLIISEGKVVEEMKRIVVERGVKNIEFLPFQPFIELGNVLASADIFLALLEDDAGLFSVPSKVLSYHCAGKPTLLIGPENNLAARIINENNSGLAIKEKSISIGLEFIAKCYSDKEYQSALGKNARKYAEANFFIDDIVKVFEETFKSLFKND